MSKKVVHILGRMDAGGVEAWLVALLKNTDPDQVQHEFLLQKRGQGFYDDEVLKYGGKLHHCLNNENPIVYGIKLYKAFKEIKPNVVHSHVHAFSGLVLLVAFLCGIENRISHSHSDTRFREKNNSFIRKGYYFFMKLLIAIFATKRIAVSSLAAENLYGMEWQTKKNCVVIPCGIDVSRYNSKYKDIHMRKELCLPDDAFVVGHVGRFEEPKNHRFLIDMFYELRKKNNKAYLVLVGDGTLKAEIEKKVEDLGLTQYVIFTGVRKDVPVIMLSVFDIFVFPSLWEGLGLVAVEAQLAGLKVILSKNIPTEANIGNAVYIENYIVDNWVSELSKSYKKNIILDDKFSIEKNIKKINKIYQAGS